MTIQYDTIKKRIDMDLLSRSSFATVVYCVIFPAILYPFDLFTISPLACWSLTGSAILISILRLIHIRLTPKFYDQSTKTWMAIFKAFSILHAIIFSTLFGLVSYAPDFHVAYTVTLVVCAGMTAGAMSSLIPNLFLSLVFPSVILLPNMSINFFIDEAQSTAWVISIYWIYLMVLAVKTNKEYMRTFAIEEQLERQKRELETLSRTDALTGLYNRGYFNTLYDIIWKTSVRNNTDLSLMMIDIDYFKRVNDSYGHLSGDECLKVVSSTLSSCLKRKPDISCRFGGEEFVILISGTPAQKTVEIAEQIRKAVESQWIVNGEHRFQVTTSIGLANISPKKHDAPVTLIEYADQALYQAKKAGRNCVRSFVIDPTTASIS